MVRRSIAMVLAAMGMLLAASVAQADTTDIIQPQNETSDQGFQAGTCIQEVDPGPPPQNCSVVTPDIFFTTAGGHATVGFTQYTIQHEPYTPLPSPPFPPGSVTAEIKEPIINRTIKTLRSDLPPGLTVNPEATPSRCTLQEFLFEPNPEGAPGVIVPACDPETRTGTQNVTLATNQDEVEVAPGFEPPKGFVVPPQPGGTQVPVYNLVPADGEPAKLGFVINARVPVFLETEVAWESDFHESFTIKLLNTTGSGFSTLISRLVADGATAGEGAGNGTYLTNPTTCFDPNEPQYEHLYSTWFRAESYGEPDPNFPHGSTPVEAKLPKDPVGTGPRVMQDGCASVPFEPSIEATPTSNAIDSPTGGTVEAKLPFDPAKEGGAANQSQSHLRRAEVSLPAGMGLNPSASKWLQACTDAQFKKGVRVEVNECPAGSIVGSAEVDSPPLAEPLKGDVYVGEQQSSNPESGNMFRILVEAKNEHEGIVLRLVGNVKANAKTGQLTAVFDDQLVGEFAGALPSGLPQVPFESVKLNFSAAKQVLTTPPTCAPAETTGQMEPWARPGTSVPVVSKFTLTSDPGGGSCPTTLGARKFAPAFKSVVDDRKAGQYTNLRVSLGRPDGQQELKGANITLPKGLTGKLAGVEYCPEAAIAAAAQRPGKAELGAWSCPTSSQIGLTSTVAGSGVHPVSLGGRAYLAGPYKGAALSMVTVTPAVSGPFDLGTVVVRVALHVNPRTAQIQAVSDVIPDVYGGVKLDLRTIAVHVDRPRFMRTPTSCKGGATAGVLNGGGSNPLDPAAFSSYPVADGFQPIDCGDLEFKPKLHTRLYGPTKRDKNPRIRAILEARNGDANIERTALVLPHSLFLDQSHIRTVCTRVQLAAKECPKAAIYGQAKARSPLLDKPLKGPVYLVSSNHKLPDLVADLRGQVNIQAYAVIGSKRGGLKTVFYNLPDVPVSKFILNMRGGQKSLLVNSENLCKGKQQAFLNIGAQNSRRFKEKNHDLRITGCGGGKKKGKK